MTAVLYSAKTKLSPAHQFVSCGRSGELWIRVETTNDDIDTALTKAKPMEGETVLNTVEYKMYPTVEKTVTKYQPPTPQGSQESNHL